VKFVKSLATRQHLAASGGFSYRLRYPLTNSQYIFVSFSLTCIKLTLCEAFGRSDVRY